MALQAPSAAAGRLEKHPGGGAREPASNDIMQLSVRVLIENEKTNGRDGLS
jgi:hypothetical protein